MLTPQVRKIALDSICGVFENLPEACESMDCVAWKYDQPEYKFVDYEDGKKYTVGIKDMMKLVDVIFDNGKRPACIPEPPMSEDEDAWDDWMCACDADSVDCLVQLAIFDEVIYG